MKKIIQISLLIVLSWISPNLWAVLPKTLNIATEATYPPFESVGSTGEIEGFDIDVMKALCKQLEVGCAFHNQPWDSLIPSLKLGKFEVLIGGMNITEARKQQVDFTDSYYTNSSIFVSDKTKITDTTPNSLKNKIVGVQGGTTAQYFLEGEYPGVKIKKYASQQDAFLDLVAGRVDLVLADTPVVKDWLKNNGSTKYALLGNPVTNTQYFGQGYGIAVKKGNSELLTALNKALAAIKQSGEYDKILKKYF